METPNSELYRCSGNTVLPSSGTTSTMKKKLAPRSSLQFKVGPGFSPTITELPIYDNEGELVSPVLCPRIDRGFDRIDNEWIGYKRNYFTLVSTFYLKDTSFQKFASNKYYTLNSKGTKLNIKYFGIRLVARCAEDKSSVSLVQHTAKRDRGPQISPPIHPTVPSELPDHYIIKQAANVRNTSKIARFNSVFYFDKNNHDSNHFNIDGLVNYPSNKILKVARYERIQFASSITQKKYHLNYRHFKLYVELVGFIGDDDEPITLAYTETPPLIIRGRSPSNYHDGGAEGDETEYSLMTSKYYNNVLTSTPNDDSDFNSFMNQSNSSNRKRVFNNDDEEDDYNTYKLLKSATKHMSTHTPMGSSFDYNDNSTPNSFDFKMNQLDDDKENMPPIKKKRGRKPKIKTLLSQVDKESSFDSVVKRSNLLPGIKDLIDPPARRIFDITPSALNRGNEINISLIDDALIEKDQQQQAEHKISSLNIYQPAQALAYEESETSDNEYDCYFQPQYQTKHHYGYKDYNYEYNEDTKSAVLQHKNPETLLTPKPNNKKASTLFSTPLNYYYKNAISNDDDFGNSNNDFQLESYQIGGYENFGNEDFFTQPNPLPLSLNLKTATPRHELGYNYCYSSYQHEDQLLNLNGKNDLFSNSDELTNNHFLEEDIYALKHRIDTKISKANSSEIDNYNNDHNNSDDSNDDDFNEANKHSPLQEYLNEDSDISK